MRYTFKVYERLKREQHINTLFRSGKAFSVFPVRVVYNLVPRSADSESPAKAGFSVPAKKFRSSVHRHRIRRLMVEAWRLHKHSFYGAVPPAIEVHLFFIYNHTVMPDYQTVENAIVKGIGRLINTVEDLDKDATAN